MPRRPDISPGADTPPVPEGPAGRPPLERVWNQKGVYSLVRQKFGAVDPQTVLGVLTDFERGRLTRPADLASRVLRDPYFHRPYLIRREAVAGRPWKVTVPESCPDAERQRCEQKCDLARATLIQLPELEQHLMLALDAIGMGIHVHEIMWGLRDGNWMPVELVPVLTREVWLDIDWTPIVRDENWRFHRTAELPGKFWVHRPSVNQGTLIDNALMSAAFSIYVVKSWMMRFWLMSAERFGSPMLQGTVDRNAPEGTRKLLMQAVKEWTSDTVVVAPDGSSISVLGSQGEASGRTYASLAEYVSGEAQILFLGSTSILNPGPNGSRSAETVRDGVRLETSTQDARMMWSSLDRDVLQWVYKYNGLDGGANPVVETIFEQEPGSITQDMIDSAAVTINELRAAARLPAIPGGEAIAVRSPPAPQLAPGAIPAKGMDSPTAAPAKPAAMPTAPARKGALGGMPDLGRVSPALRAALNADR